MVMLIASVGTGKALVAVGDNHSAMLMLVASVSTGKPPETVHTGNSVAEFEPLKVLFLHNNCIPPGKGLQLSCLQQ